MLKPSLTATLLCGVLATPALAHEDHQMECSETAIHAMHADIQAMTDGESKTMAMKEMDMAEEMMAKKDTDACMTHMHKAMEEIEK
ncbi:MAG: hypothetical protein FJX44_06425 [Alphaproteobacteria bacterium]|nr:hypothetical protein [Alphaproteobacteria bacterium]